MASQDNLCQGNGAQHVQHFKVRRVRPMRIESFRRKSLADVLESTHKAVRKDSVVPLTMCGEGSSLTVPREGAIRKLSRKLSLRPPTTVYTERSEMQDHVPEMTSQFKLKPEVPQLLGHHVTCECGKVVFIPCLAAKLSKDNTYLSPKVSPNVSARTSPSVSTAVSPAVSPLTSPTQGRRRRSSLREIVDFVSDKMTVYDAVLKACKEIELAGEADSVDVVLSRQSAVKCLFAAMRQFPKKMQLLLQACKSLLRQTQLSAATPRYIADCDGISFLYGLLKRYPDHRDLKLAVLDIFAFVSINDEIRNHLAEKGNQSDFLTTMSRDESDVLVVQKCCVIIGNIVASANTALTLMYVGGVHSIINIMEKYSTDTDVLQHCCTALGTFASHDDTCEHVAEAGATKAVTSAMETHAHHSGIQESCCWAFSSLSRCDSVCKSLLKLGAYGTLTKTMSSYSQVNSIQEYGCWALCNMSAVGVHVGALWSDAVTQIRKLRTMDKETVLLSFLIIAYDMSEKQASKAVELLVDCLGTGEDNVELIEQICFALNVYVTANASTHNTVVRTGCIRLLIDKMKLLEDNVNIQINSCKILGNLAVNAELRHQIEDEKASEVIITSMFRLDNNLTLQNTGCMVLTNLSADVPDNKFRILKNGGVAAILAALRTYKTEEQLQASGLKALCNLLESDQACWSIAEEDGVKIISDSIKLFPSSVDVVSFGCMALSNLPRKGTPMTALTDAVETLKYLYRMTQRKCEVALNLLMFYENALTAGNLVRELFDATAIKLLHAMMEHFTDIEVQLSCCKIIAQLSMAPTINLLDATTYDLMLSTMQSFISEPSVQVVCCGTVSYLASSGELKKLIRCFSRTLSLILKSLTRHSRNIQLTTVGIMAIENILRTDTFEMLEHDVTQVVQQAMLIHQNSTDIQTSGQNILAKLEQEKYKDMETTGDITAV